MACLFLAEDLFFGGGGVQENLYRIGIDLDFKGGWVWG